MNPNLSQIISIINGYSNAKDADRVFTYIEFVKMFGYENDVNTFIGVYKTYVTKWANIKKQSIEITNDDFVMSKMVDILKSITLDYSSYEEQDFIANIDLYNKSHLKALSALFSRKIRQITSFYRKKRNEAVTVIRKNSMRGSKKSIEEVIYEKVFDFVFSNRNILPSYQNLKRDLMISVENYVDTYSEYFDIPRQKEFTDQSRAEMLSANMNDVDYRMYLEIELVVSEILFSGNVYLEEIPLVAQVGADLSQSCVGDMLALKNNLMANTQINQVELTEQIALKRRLYEKFLGCDLWYMYVDLQGNITMDVLCKAKNPTGNLLNCATADTATIENEQLTLLSHIGLFFKPDKTSILKVNAKDYSWTVDLDVIENDTMYVFPDPSKYGDIGNNKQGLYPLIMQYKLDYDLRNLSSGLAMDDPIKMITDQGWYSYYSKQEDDFRHIKNTDYEYVFTWLANRGFITNYQQDIWGNHFGILKGFDVEYKYAEDGKTIIGVDKITVQEDYILTAIKGESGSVSGKGIILNGGYFEDPFHKGQKVTIIINNPDEDAKYYGKRDISYHYKDRVDKVPFELCKRKVGKNTIYERYIGLKTQTQWKDLAIIENGNYIGEDVAYKYQPTVRYNVPIQEIINAGNKWEDYYLAYQKTLSIWVSDTFNDYDTRPFDYNKTMILDDYYNWSGVHINNHKFFYPSQLNYINFGTFDKYSRWSNEKYYVDNIFKTSLKYLVSLDLKDVIVNVVEDFVTKDVYTEGDVAIETTKHSFKDIKKQTGNFYIKTIGDLYSKPKLLQDVFSWVNWEKIGQPIDFFIVRDILVVESDLYYTFIPYSYNGSTISNALGVREMFKVNKKWKHDVEDVKNEIITSKMLYVLNSNKIYITQIQIISDDVNYHTYVIPTIHSFDVKSYKMLENVHLGNMVYSSLYLERKLNKEKLYHDFMTKKLKYTEEDSYESLFKFIQTTEDEVWSKTRDLEIPYFPVAYKMDNIQFSYNSALGSFLISYVLVDNNGTPYIYEYKFKIDNLEYFLGSLITNVYSIKNLGVTYRWNDKPFAKHTATNGTDDTFGGIFTGSIEYDSEVTFLDYDVEFGTDVAKTYTYDAVESIRQYYITFDESGESETHGYTYRTNEKISDYGVSFRVDRSLKYNYENTVQIVGDKNSEQFAVDVSRVTIIYNDDGTLQSYDTEHLENGSDMFMKQSMTKFNGNLDNLIEGEMMFYSCENLRDFNSTLPKLKDGWCMFLACPLSISSIERIVNSLPTYTDGETHTIDIGVPDLSNETKAEVQRITGIDISGLEQSYTSYVKRITGMYKGWEMNFSYAREYNS